MSKVDLDKYETERDTASFTLVTFAFVTLENLTLGPRNTHKTKIYKNNQKNT